MGKAVPGEALVLNTPFGRNVNREPEGPPHRVPGFVVCHILGDLFAFAVGHAIGGDHFPDADGHFWFPDSITIGHAAA